MKPKAFEKDETSKMQPLSTWKFTERHFIFIAQSASLLTAYFFWSSLSFAFSFISLRHFAFRSFASFLMRMAAALAAAAAFSYTTMLSFSKGMITGLVRCLHVVPGRGRPIPPIETGCRTIDTTIWTTVAKSLWTHSTINELKYLPTQLRQLTLQCIQTTKPHISAGWQCRNTFQRCAVTVKTRHSGILHAQAF